MASQFLLKCSLLGCFGSPIPHQSALLILKCMCPFYSGTNIYPFLCSGLSVCTQAPFVSSLAALAWDTDGNIPALPCVPLVLWWLWSVQRRLGTPRSWWFLLSLLPCPLQGCTCCLVSGQFLVLCVRPCTLSVENSKDVICRNYFLLRSIIFAELLKGVSWLVYHMEKYVEVRGGGSDCDWPWGYF
jgi:hypothetical protein